MFQRKNIDFFKCGHTITSDNVAKAGRYKDGMQAYRCKQCSNLRSRLRYKPRLRASKFSPIFPCGHPRIEANKYRYTWRKKGYSKTYRIYRCKICYRKHCDASRKRLGKKQKSKWIPKRKVQFTIGSIIVGNCYESDTQCKHCGYMLRYTRTDVCVACERARTMASNARRKLVAAKKQHATDSYVNRASRTGLTDMADLRQDAPP